MKIAVRGSQMGEVVEVEMLLSEKEQQFLLDLVRQATGHPPKDAPNEVGWGTGGDNPPRGGTSITAASMPESPPTCPDCSSTLRPVERAILADKYLCDRCKTGGWLSVTASVTGKPIVMSAENYTT
jgi:hypothetical protein